MPLMTIEPDGERVPVRPGETILEAMYSSGYSYRIGCRRGGCAICKVDLVEGEVTYTKPVATNVLPEDEIAQGTCLSCRAAPVGDITIRLRDESVRVTNRMLRAIRLKQYEKDQAKAEAEAAARAAAQEATGPEA